MSDPSDFESVISDVIILPCSSLDDINANAISHSRNITININNDTSTIKPVQHDLSLTDSEHSLLEVPKLLNVSSPSSICSTRPLEWDSGADVGYDITSNHQSQDMSTIERIAVSSLMYNANSTPLDYEKRTNIHTKSNSLINLNEIQLPKGNKSASFEALQFTGLKSDTLPKCRSPMASSISVSTVVHKLESFNTASIKKLNEKHINLIFNHQEKRFNNLKIESNTEQKSSDSSKESNSTLGSANTAESWVAKEFHDSTNTTTDRVNSFEYLPGNVYYNGRNDEPEDSDKEIKQSTKMLVEAMKDSGLTNELQRNKIFKEIIESFLKNYVHKDSQIKSASDTDQTPIRQDFTSQTSNTANTIVNNQKNNQSSTITFTSPITSSRYGDDLDSKYDESSMDSGRHINLQKCKSKKNCIPFHKRKNQGVQCTISDSYTNINMKKKPFTFTKSNSLNQDKENLKSYPKVDAQSKPNYNDLNKEFKKQMIWFHTNYMKTERENQMLWINSQISHLKNLKKLMNTHEELKKNWNLYKQKQATNNKSMSRRHILPISNSSSDFTTTTKTNSTISSKQYSDTSKYDLMTDAESSTTICDHVHYKKGILLDEPKSMKNCCEKTLHVIEEKHKQNVNNCKAASSQTSKLNETYCKNNKQSSSRSDTTYSVSHQLKSTNNKSSISYDIIFKPTSRSRCIKKTNFINNKSTKNEQNNSVSVACQTTEVPFKSKLSLQEYLIMNRPDYICQAEKRQNILSNLASLRDERKQLKRDFLITNNCEEKLPSNPLAVRRIMSQKEMRKQTERKYRKCPEVKNKKVELKRKEEYITNKILANIFNKKLQKKALKGKVDLSNSVSVCSL